MQSFRGLIRNQIIKHHVDSGLWRLISATNTSSVVTELGSTSSFQLQEKCSLRPKLVSSCCCASMPALPPRSVMSEWAAFVPTISSRFMTTVAESVTHNSAASLPDPTPYVKFKRLDKTAKHIMQIIDKEAVEEVKAQREIPDIRPGYTIQLKMEVPENKRRVSIIRGTVIARRNAGLNTTIRLRRLVAGVGVESLFLLYSPTIKEMKVLDKKKVRRAKLYYLRDRMKSLKKPIK